MKQRKVIINRLNSNGIGRRLMVVILLFSSVVTLVLTSYQLYLDFQHDVTAIEIRLDEIRHTHIHSISASLWNMNLELLRLQMEGVAQLPGVIGVEVNENPDQSSDPLHLTIGNIAIEPQTIQRNYRLVYSEPGQDSRLVGQLYVNASLKEIYTRLLNKALVILASQGVKTFLVSFFILFMVHQIVTRHLITISRHAAAFDFQTPQDLDRLHNELSLNRVSTPRNRGDELDQVTSAFNQMQSNLIGYVDKLQTSEKRFALAMHGANDGLWDWNLESDDIYLSPRWKSMLGYGEEELECHPNTWSSHLHPEDVYLTSQAVEDYLKGRLDRYKIEYRMRHKDGHYIPIESRGHAIRDESGKPVRFVGTHVDLTERKKAEREKENLESRLAQAQKMEAIGTLAGGIAHDFNNILAAMLGYAEMARDDSPPGSTVAKDLDQVLEGGNRAKDLVQQILAFSRQNEMERIPLQPVSVVKEAIKMLRPSLPTTIEINQDIPPATGLILADPTQIHQILMNLCTNAFHAMEETGGKLDISVKEISLSAGDLVHEPDVEAGAFVQLSISDSGPGIPPDIKKNIFDPYFTTKETGKGTGMGLAIVYGIVKSYGGFLSLHSESGKGTAFHVVIPVIEKEQLPEKEDVKPIPVGMERILFIDDEEILSGMGKSMLERLGYHVTARHNSIEALETFQNQPDLFDLVITDQTMPGMTGTDIARRMMQIRPDIPIILCTGYSTVISEEKAKSIGIKEFALKPLSKKAIAVLIRKVLDK